MKMTERIRSNLIMLSLVAIVFIPWYIFSQRIDNDLLYTITMFSVVFYSLSILVLYNRKDYQKKIIGKIQKVFR